MSKTLNTLFEIGGSRLYDSVKGATDELIRQGFSREQGRYRLYPDDSEVDEAYQSGWVEANIQLDSSGKYYLVFEFIL